MSDENTSIPVGGIPAFTFGTKFVDDDAEREATPTPEAHEVTAVKQAQTAALPTPQPAVPETSDDSQGSSQIDIEPADRPVVPKVAAVVTPSSKWRRMLQVLSSLLEQWGDTVLRTNALLLLVLLVLMTHPFARVSVQTFVMAIAAVWYVYVTLLQRHCDKTTTRPWPNVGKRKALHRTLRFVGFSYIPKQGATELRQIEELHVQALIEQERREQYDLAQTRKAFMVVFGPSGGVGKSTFATAAAYTASECNYVSNLLLDARIKRGTLTERMGLWRRGDATMPQLHTTLTLDQTFECHEAGLFDIPTQTQVLLGKVPGRQLYVVASNMAKDEHGLEVDMDRFKATLKTERNQFQLVFAECSDVVASPFDKLLMEEGTIPVFVHRVTKPMSEGELTQGLSIYTKMSEDIAQKIKNHGVLVIMAARDGQTPEEFSAMFGTLIPPERTFLVDDLAFFGQDFTDKGHDNPSKIDYSRPPRRTLDLDQMPPEAELQIRRAYNAGLRTVPVFSFIPSAQRTGLQ